MASPEQMRRAIEIYLEHAYAGVAVPAAVRQRIEALRGLGPDELYRSEVLEAAPAEQPSQFNLRLGNRWYPHMKLVVERSPDRRAALFRADTHDQHCCVKPGDRDYDAFTQMMRNNQQVAQQIEAAWERQGLPTFKSYLKQDLARRSGTHGDE